jgi:hypothetical protein
MRGKRERRGADRAVIRRWSERCRVFRSGRMDAEKQVRTLDSVAFLGCDGCTQLKRAVLDLLLT